MNNERVEAIIRGAMYSGAMSVTLKYPDGTEWQSVRQGDQVVVREFPAEGANARHTLDISIDGELRHRLGATRAKMLMQVDLSGLSAGKRESLFRFIEHRKNRRVKVYAPAGVTMLISKWNEFTDEEISAAVDTSVANNYQGMFPKKHTNNYNHGQSKLNTHGAATRDQLGAARSRLRSARGIGEQPT